MTERQYRNQQYANAPFVTLISAFPGVGGGEGVLEATACVTVESYGESVNWGTFSSFLRKSSQSYDSSAACTMLAGRLLA